MLSYVRHYASWPFRNLGKLLRGEKLFISPRPAERWDREFKAGSWDQLVSEHRFSGNMAMIAHALMFMTDDSQKRLLDVGCGNGALAQTLERIGRKFEYVGSDISSEALKRLTSAHPAAVTVCADMMDVDAVPGDFDVIVFSECIYYSDYDEALRRYRKKARPGALIIVSMHGGGSRHWLWARIGRHFDELGSFSVTENESKSFWNVKVFRYREATS